MAATVGNDAYGMTDRQWDGIIQLITMLAEKCKDKEEILTELRKLLKSADKSD